MTTARVLIHGGGASLDNGAKFPRSFYFNLARLLEVTPLTGQFDGDDRLEIPLGMLPIAEDLLKENCMLYQVEGRDSGWQNVLTQNVAHRLAHHGH